MKKEILITQLEEKTVSIIAWVEAQAADQFAHQITPEKWSTGQHLEHLIKSTKPLNQALNMPKMALRGMFGKNNRVERTYDELVEKYQGKLAEGIPPNTNNSFAPKPVENSQKNEVLTNFRKEVDNFKKVLDKWDEKNLSAYILPHPLIGKLTIREMLYFTIYHTEHHHLLLKRDYMYEV